MLRLVVQVSMFLALPLMAFCLYWKVDLAPWYIAYVLLFNVLVGPVFSAGSVTSERERQTLDLLLTTIISPFQILWGKLIAGLRVSSVLTSFLVWPVLLAWAMGSFGWENVLSVPAYLAVIALTCLTTATIALFCSVLFRKTATSMMTSYLIIGALFCLPLCCGSSPTRIFRNRRQRPGSIVRPSPVRSPRHSEFRSTFNRRRRPFAPIHGKCSSPMRHSRRHST